MYKYQLTFDILDGFKNEDLEFVMKGKRIFFKTLSEAEEYINNIVNSLDKRFKEIKNFHNDFENPGLMWCYSFKMDDYEVFCNLFLEQISEKEA